jgi:crotonobetainyl-CoA:carnitine CoA-transferase CaiB-like acyl-CoA transferase
MSGMAEQLWPGLLAEAWAALAAAGGSADDRLPAGLEVLWVSGAPGHLPSRLPVEDVAVACTGAALLAAAALHAQRGGDDGARGSPTAQLDLGHVAAAFRSEAYLRINGKPTGPGFAPLSRFWRAADGWVRTHGNYPWHRSALLRALSCSDDPKSVAAAIAALGARDAEDLVVAAGGVAAAVRAEDSWRSEPPGQAVAAARLVEGMSIGGAPPRWRLAGALPASGIRVLDLTRVIAGPVATRYLGALGADVLRLDAPDRPELTLHAYDGLPGKRSALLDFGIAGGSARLHELLSGADVLVHGYRPGALDRFGLSPELLAERHPGLVVASLSAWGSRGPWGGRRGFDSIVQAASGIAMAESADGERPGAMPCQLLDHGTGYLCAAAALQALARQSAHGGTEFRELSLARTAHWLLGLPRDAAVPSPVADGEDPAWLVTLDSADGPVTTVRPPGRLDDEALSWPRSLSRYGGDQPAWGQARLAGLVSWSYGGTLVPAVQSVHQFLISGPAPLVASGFPGHQRPNAG